MNELGGPRSLSEEDPTFFRLLEEAASQHKRVVSQLHTLSDENKQLRRMLNASGPPNCFQCDSVNGKYSPSDIVLAEPTDFDEDTTLVQLQQVVMEIASRENSKAMEVPSKMYATSGQLNRKARPPEDIFDGTDGLFDQSWQEADPTKSGGMGGLSSEVTVGETATPPGTPPEKKRRQSDQTKLSEAEKERLSKDMTRGAGRRVSHSGLNQNERQSHIVNFIADQSNDAPRTKYARFLNQVFLLLEDENSSKCARVWSYTMKISIVVSWFLNVVQTFQYPPFQEEEVAVLEVLFDVVFLVEIILRYLSSRNQSDFFYNVHNFIDMLGLCSMIARIVLLLVEDTESREEARYFILCVVPVLRSMKMLRRWKKFQLLFNCGLKLLMDVMPSLLFLLGILAQVFGTLVYMVEPRDNIESLPDSLWFTLITMSTVGYGDVSPVTPYGKCVTSVLVIISALYMAVPIGIVGSAFHDVWQDKDRLLLIGSVTERLKVLGIAAVDIPYMFGRFGGLGVLTLKDFQLMLLQLDLNIAEDKQLALFASFDSDGSGELGAKEFVMIFFPSDFVHIYGTAEREDIANAATAAGIEDATKEKQAYLDGGGDPADVAGVSFQRSIKAAQAHHNSDVSPKNEETSKNSNGQGNGRTSLL
jgi:hypothetical protein